MGIFLFYEGDGRIAGEISTAHWRQMRRILPVLIDWLNEATKARHSPPPPATLLPEPFKLSSLIRDEADTKEEINIRDRHEMKRLFAWCDFLAPLDEAYALFDPIVRILRAQSRHPDEPRVV